MRCLDTFDGSQCQLLLSGSDDQTIKLWHIDHAETDQTTKLQQMFDVVWDQSAPDPYIPLLAAVDDTNKLQVQFRMCVHGTPPGRVLYRAKIVVTLTEDVSFLHSGSTFILDFLSKNGMQPVPNSVPHSVVNMWYMYVIL